MVRNKKKRFLLSFTAPELNCFDQMIDIYLVIKVLWSS
jgi:hypothetical protein